MKYNYNFIISDHQLTLVFISGYSHPLILRNDAPAQAYQLDQWYMHHNHLRAIVEMTFALIKSYRLAKDVCTLSPEKHAVALMVIYHLVNRLYFHHPIRPIEPQYLIDAQVEEHQNIEIAEVVDEN